MKTNQRSLSHHKNLVYPYSSAILCSDISHYTQLAVENPPQEQNDNTTVIPIPSNPVQQNQTEESKEEKSKSPVQVEMKQNDHSPAQMQNKESDMSDTEEVVHHKKDSVCSPWDVPLYVISAAKRPTM